MRLHFPIPGPQMRGTGGTLELQMQVLRFRSRGLKRARDEDRGRQPQIPRSAEKSAPLGMTGDGLRFVLPHPSEAWIHPTDEGLSVGTPEMGHLPILLFL
jgi:hypothetical protein